MIGLSKKYSLLFVEDDTRTQKLYYPYLSHYFNSVYLAGDGREGIAMYREFHPDIILADIDLPYLNGLDMISEIRKSSKKTKIIILTAFLDHDKLLQAVELNLIRYLKKPASRKELSDAFTKAIYELEAEKDKNVVLLKEGYWWNKSTHILFKETEMIQLSNNETALLIQFIHSSGHVLTIDSIQNASWDDTFTMDSFKSTLKRLRKKLPDDTIVNLFAIGYLLETQQE